VARASRPPVTFEALKAASKAVPAAPDRTVHDISIDTIGSSARNPRHQLRGIDDLAASLEAYGLLQPVVVRRVDQGHELIAGHRRLAAALRLGWTQIAAVVRHEEADDAYLLTLTENLQREDLTPSEEAAALEVLVRERGWSTRQVGTAIKRSHAYVSRRLRVFEDVVLAPLVLRNELALSTAEELLGVSDAARRKELAERAVREGWERPHVRAALQEADVVRSVPAAAERGREIERLVVALLAALSAGPAAELSERTRKQLLRLRDDLARLARPEPKQFD
jgi:ParB family chromosome partitioning protein